jgi:hypothetical protein
MNIAFDFQVAHNKFRGWLRKRRRCRLEESTRHCHPGEIHPGSGAGHRARYIDQVLGVVAGIVPVRQNGIVTGLFGQGRERPFQPPGSRMKPEDSAVQESEPLHERIPASGMLVLACQDGVELHPRPLAPLFRLVEQFLNSVVRDTQKSPVGLRTPIKPTV